TAETRRRRQLEKDGIAIVERNLETQFARIGARLKVDEGVSLGRARGSFAVDVQRDRGGEVFAITTRPGAVLRLDVVGARPAERHLLLLVEETGVKQKFLCGHDERQWFVAAVPERERAAGVREAMEALKPVEVRAAQARKRVPVKERQRRKTDAYIRQGEWFCLPAPDLAVDELLVTRNEPLTRGEGSKPHVAEFCYRTGGETVYVCDRHPRGLTEAQYRRL